MARSVAMAGSDDGARVPLLTCKPSSRAISVCRAAIVMPGVTIAYRTFGSPRARPRQCGAGDPWQHQRSADDRSRWIDRRRQLERDRRPRQGGRYQPLLRHLPEHAGVVLRLDQCGEHRSHEPASAMDRGFPTSRCGDIVATQRALLDHLGIEKLVAIVGPSYGGSQAFQWAVNYPGMMRGIAASRHRAGRSARTVGRKRGAAARHAIAGPELERR